MTDEKKRPLDAVADLVVFAPLGLALTARENLPELITKGRTQLNSQVTMARMIGQFAVTEGEKDLRKRLEGLAATLSALGILPEPAEPEPTAPEPAVPAPGGVAAPPHEAAPPDGPAPDSAALAIPGYDTLSASQVVQRLAGLAPDELEAVRQYEGGTRGRRTILSKVSQLQSGAGT